MGPGFHRDAKLKEQRTPVSALLAEALHLHAGVDNGSGAVAGLLMHDAGLLAHDAGTLPIALPRREDILVDGPVALDGGTGEAAAVLISGFRRRTVATGLGPIAGAAATREQQQREHPAEARGAVHRGWSMPRRRVSRRARIACFSAALASYQARISSIVRRQPRHVRVAGSIRQMPRQGEGGCASLVVTFTSLSRARPDRRAGCATASRDPALSHSTTRPPGC